MHLGRSEKSRVARREALALVAELDSFVRLKSTRAANLVRDTRVGLDAAAPSAGASPPRVDLSRFCAFDPDPATRRRSDPLEPSDATTAAGPYLRDDDHHVNLERPRESRHPRARRLLGARVAGAHPKPRRQLPGRIRATHAPPPAPAADPSRCGVGARTCHPSSASEVARRFIPASRTPGSLRLQAHRRRPRPSAPSTRKHRRRADRHRVGIITAYTRRADRPSPRTGPRGIVVVGGEGEDVVGIGIGIRF